MKRIHGKGPLAVVAIGGNALIPEKGELSSHAQREVARTLAGHVADMLEDGWRVLMVHGNGPHVGMVLRRSDLTREVLPTIPVDMAVSDTQGEIGYLLQNALNNEFLQRGLHASASALISQTVVSLDDPAFQDPDKPIGQFMSEDQARALSAAEGWTVKEDAGRGWRRVIPSPRPLRVVESATIAALLDQGEVVIAGGGGGIPVVECTEGLRGVDAVVDKDRVAALLAIALEADLLLIPTGVERVALNFGKPDQCWLEHLSLDEAKRYMSEGQFAAGSMGPKVEAIVEFLNECPHGRGVITNLESIRRALMGMTGTSLYGGEA